MRKFRTPAAAQLAWQARRTGALLAALSAAAVTSVGIAMAMSGGTTSLVEHTSEMTLEPTSTTTTAPAGAGPEVTSTTAGTDGRAELAAQRAEVAAGQAETAAARAEETVKQSTTTTTGVAPVVGTSPTTTATTVPASEAPETPPPAVGEEEPTTTTSAPATTTTTSLPKGTWVDVSRFQGLMPGERQVVLTSRARCRRDDSDSSYSTYIFSRYAQGQPVICAGNTSPGGQTTTVVATTPGQHTLWIYDRDYRMGYSDREEYDVTLQVWMCPYKACQPPPAVGSSGN